MSLIDCNFEIIFMSNTSIELIYQKLVDTDFRICTDTRKEVANSFFICLSGEVFDGNLFAQKAVELGAKFVLTNNITVNSDKVILVEDPNLILAELSRFHSEKISNHTKFISIGGSNGKTTTKELIMSIFQDQFNSKATIGNLNNHIGVPLTLLSFDEKTDYGIVELGTNHPGEMAFLCDLFEPHAGLITNIGKEHLEGFGSIESVAKEESELYLQLINSGGQVAINLDDTWLNSMSKRFSSPFTYSCENASANLFARVLEEMPYLKFELIENGKNVGLYESKLGGKFNIYNILGALSMSRIFGLDFKKAIESVCQYEPKNNRSQWLQFEKYLVFLDAYNANPSSVQAGLQSFATMNGSKAILLGDMLELGESSSIEHVQIFELAQSLNFDEIYLVGNEYKTACGHFPYCFESVDSLLAWLDTHPIQSKNVFIKGSRGIAMEKSIEHFS
jgi:UDP-N-acetylmuramoyl-tripeptide--D-alanyl-D-alanine ligase